MTDTDVKNEDLVSQDQDDGGDDEVRDGLSAASSPNRALGAMRMADSLAKT